MIPFDPWASSVRWHQTWRKHIRAAKSNPEQLQGYCRAACIAQAQYVMDMATDKVKFYHPKGQP